MDARRFARIGQSRVIALPNFVQREMDLCTLGDEFLTLTFFFFHIFLLDRNLISKIDELDEIEFYQKFGKKFLT